MLDTEYPESRDTNRGDSAGSTVEAAPDAKDGEATPAVRGVIGLGATTDVTGDAAAATGVAGAGSVLAAGLMATIM
jgi:hypothetical protein